MKRGRVPGQHGAREDLRPGCRGRALRERAAGRLRGRRLVPAARAADHPWRTTPNHGMTRTSRARASRRRRATRRGPGNPGVLLRRQADPEEYLIVDGGQLAGAGAHSYSEGTRRAARTKPPASTRECFPCSLRSADRPRSDLSARELPLDEAIEEDRRARGATRAGCSAGSSGPRRARRAGRRAARAAVILDGPPPARPARRGRRGRGDPAARRRRGGGLRRGRRARPAGGARPAREGPLRWGPRAVGGRAGRLHAGLPRAQAALQGDRRAPPRRPPGRRTRLPQPARRRRLRTRRRSPRRTPPRSGSRDPFMWRDRDAAPVEILDAREPSSGSAAAASSSRSRS